MAKDEKAKCCLGEEVRIGPELRPGVHAAIRHTEDHQTSLGLAFRCENGKPLPANAEPLEHIEGNRYRTSPLEHVGPSRAATPAYRDGWDRIFGGKQPVGQA